MGKPLSVLVGCDPEVFVSQRGKKNIISAHGLIPGSKHDPHDVLDGMVQVDGCALEFGIKPAKTAYEWYDRVTSVMKQLTEMVPGHKLHIQPVAEFDEKYFQRDVPEEAKMLGCEPDWNAWTGDINPPPDLSSCPNMRSAGGHIHVGWCKGKDPYDKVHMEDCRAVAKQMDYYVGIWSLNWDGDARRRTLYGKAGTYRPKPYGLEYRMPSNMWLSANGLIDWVYYSTRLAVRDLSQGISREKDFGAKAQEIIDNNQLDWKSHGYKAQKLWAWHPAYTPEQYQQPAYKEIRGPIYAE